MKRIRLDINFYKVVVGVAFSLVWARVMYWIWREPTYITFIWFYLGIGSILLKWVLFAIVDRIHTSLRLRAVREELDISATRVDEITKDIRREKEQRSIIPGPDIHLEDKIKKVDKEVISLCNLVEEAIDRAISSLREKDDKLAVQIIENDYLVDQQELAVTESCLQILGSGCPQGMDLRKIVSLLAVVTELERIGDYAKGIANITLMIGSQPLLKPLIDIPRMAQLGIKMMRESLDSFFEKDIEKAKRIYQSDDEIDQLYDQVFRELVLFMVEDPKTITQATRLIWVAHNLERVGDRVTNICEQVVFYVTGKTIDIETNKSR